MAINPIYNINNNSPVINFDDCKHYVAIDKLKDKTSSGYILGLVKDICFAVKRIFTRIGRSENYKVEIAGTPSEGLICMFHGLKAHPSQHDRIRDALVEKFQKKVTYHQPFVTNAGNGKRSEIIDPHLKQVLNWARNNPLKPISLIGISNGVLISSEIAIAIKDQGLKNPIKVFGIAGPIFGTTLMNKPNSSQRIQKIWNWLLTSKLPFIGGHSPAVVQEMSWAGPSAMDLVKRIRIAANKGVSFTFCATSDDSKVVPAASGFPSDVSGATYHPFSREGHSSIADAAIPTIKQSLGEFMTKNQPEIDLLRD
jgi:hypothetical protein